MKTIHLPFLILHITVNSGTWLVRYRNVKTSVCNIINPTGPTNGDWGNSALWISEVCLCK